MVDIIANKIDEDKYNIVIDSFMLKELSYAIKQLNSKRQTLLKISEKSIKERKGEDYTKRKKKKKDIINLLINKLDINSVSNKLIVENLVVNNLVVNNLVVNNLVVNNL